jgi:murein DD-endopeptidase MepM/ murein hydrolase activator NlpD
MRSFLLCLVLGFLGLSGAAHADPIPMEESPADTEHATSDETPALMDGESPATDEGESDTREDRPTRRRREFRWSDGPRRVPTPRGASRARAERLELGTRTCASRLLHGAPEARWTSAVTGAAPSRLLWPVDDGGWVRGFGYVRVTRPELLHRGIDIAAPIGTTVRAVADGIVAYADNGVHGYGNLVMIVHANGWMSLYAHNSRVTVPAGYRVRRGERIALVGQTGIAHGPHVHFELWQDGHAVDPAPLMDGGPAFVDRLAARAAARGDVPPPEEVTAADRPVEPELPPFVDEGAAPSETPSVAASRPLEPPPETRADALALGTRALADHLRAHPLPDALAPTIVGRRFGNLLFPVRGGAIARSYRSARRPLELSGEAGAAVRAAADGVVVFAGELASGEGTVIVAHPTGWVTFYERLDVAVSVGDVVERGAWLGHLGERAMRFSLRVGGVSRDPAPSIVDPRGP